MFNFGGVVSSVLTALPYHLSFTIAGISLFTIYW